MLSRLLTVLLIVAFCAPKSPAQKATAPNGYYPSAFHGAIFTGRLESVRPDLQEFTLTYTSGKKSEQFVGRLQGPCTWKDKNGESHLSKIGDLVKDSVLTAFYIPAATKVNGVKTEENSVFALSFAEANGKRIEDAKRVIIYCSEGPQQLVFKAF